MPTQEFTFGVAISNPSPRWKPVLHRTLRDAPLCGSGSYIRSLNPQLVEAAIAEAGNFPYCKNCERIAESFKGRLYRQLFQTS